MIKFINSFIVLKTAEENEKVSGIAKGKGFWTGGYRAAGGSKPWTGMWKWSDKSSFSFSNWHAGQPDHGHQLYISSNFNLKRGAWDDEVKSFKYPFVCKCRYFI